MDIIVKNNRKAAYSIEVNGQTVLIKINQLMQSKEVWDLFNQIEYLIDEEEIELLNVSVGGRSNVDKYTFVLNLAERFPNIKKVISIEEIDSSY